MLLVLGLFRRVFVGDVAVLAALLAASARRMTELSTNRKARSRRRSARRERAGTMLLPERSCARHCIAHPGGGEGKVMPMRWRMHSRISGNNDTQELAYHNWGANRRRDADGGGGLRAIHQSNHGCVCIKDWSATFSSLPDTSTISTLNRCGEG